MRKKRLPMTALEMSRAKNIAKCFWLVQIKKCTFATYGVEPKTLKTRQFWNLEPSFQEKISKKSELISCPNIRLVVEWNMHLFPQDSGGVFPGDITSGGRENTWKIGLATLLSVCKNILLQLITIFINVWPLWGNNGTCTIVVFGICEK